jgi:hypothetical protein
LKIPVNKQSIIVFDKIDRMTLIGLI